MLYLLYALMAVAVVGIVYGWKKQKDGYPLGEKIMLAGALGALICAGFALKISFFGTSSTEMMKMQNAWTRLSGQKLGEYLATTYPKSKILIVVQPQTAYTKGRPTPLLDGLKAGLGDSMTIVAEAAPELPKMPGGMPGMVPMPPIPPPVAGDKSSNPPPSMPTPEEMLMMGPIEMWLNAERFDAFLEPFVPKVDMVITTIGLPMQPGTLKFWKFDPRPMLVIAQGNIQELKVAIQAKAVVAALAFNPTAKFESKWPPKNLEKAFALRYLLVTPENVEQIATEHKDMFFLTPTQ